MLSLCMIMCRYQKAYVECFCSAQNLQLLMKAVEDDRHGSMTYIASDVRGNMYVFCACLPMGGLQFIGILNSTLSDALAGFQVYEL